MTVLELAVSRKGCRQLRAKSAFVAEKPDANDLPAHSMGQVRVQTAVCWTRAPSLMDVCGIV